MASAQAAPNPGNAAAPQALWRFIVSGDSRNCGDIVMPAIASDSARFHPSFYWHLGDLRAIYKIDEDIAFSNANQGHKLSCEAYERIAWSDLAANQIEAFGDLPFFLGIGNHETISPKTEALFKQQFAEWLDQPVLQHQRELDKEPKQPEPYYHWIRGGVDFIYLDNASDCFADEQLTWLRHRLTAAKSDAAVKSVVVGMHEALPNSLASNHAMGDNPKNEPDSLDSGKKAYAALVAFRDESHKHVYVLSSHSHFFMANIFATPELTANGATPLDGWIVGTAGAERYKLPDPPPAGAKTDTYGYLLGTVSENGTIQFSYQELHTSDVPQYVWERYPAKEVHWCFEQNSQSHGKQPSRTDMCPTLPHQACHEKQ